MRTSPESAYCCTGVEEREPGSSTSRAAVSV